MPYRSPIVGHESRPEENSVEVVVEDENWPCEIDGEVNFAACRCRRPPVGDEHTVESAHSDECYQENS